MELPLKIVARLQSGRRVAAEVSAPSSDTRAYLVIIPQTPSPNLYPERWFKAGSGEAYLRDQNDISGYEIRFLQHLAQYTDEEWGWDYDQVMADQTTRVKRIFVQTIEDIWFALEPWNEEALLFQHPHVFDSSLVSNPIEGYLDKGDSYPHLWQA